MKGTTVLRGILCLAFIAGAIAGGCRRTTDPETETPVNIDPRGSAHPLAESGEVAVLAEAEADDSIAVTVVNGTNAPLEVRRALRIEQEREGEWHELMAVGAFWLRENCTAIDGVLYPETMAEDCVSVEANLGVEVRPWNGSVGDAQCICERCARVPAGRYRVVLRDCHGGRVESEPFNLGEHEEADGD